MLNRPEENLKALKDLKFCCDEPAECHFCAQCASALCTARCVMQRTKTTCTRRDTAMARLRHVALDINDETSHDRARGWSDQIKKLAPPPGVQRDRIPAGVIRSELMALYWPAGQLSCR